ncbi:hypothetical protein EB001_05340 [bacterium]|nr:hypothetical protein [bacterium]
MTTLWNNKSLILEGIKNYLFTTDTIEQIALERYTICQACPKLDLLGTDCLAPGTQPCCSECGCSLKFKTRSLSSSCPVNKWPALLSQEEEDDLLSKL